MFSMIAPQLHKRHPVTMGRPTDYRSLSATKRCSTREMPTSEKRCAPSGLTFRVPPEILRAKGTPHKHTSHCSRL